MLFESSQTGLDSNSGNVWWFYSELTYPTDSVDSITGISTGINNTGSSLTKNAIQWVPFGSLDVVHLEHSFQQYQGEAGHLDTTGKVDEFKAPTRFASVLRDSRQYLKVDLERMRMGPIYWEGEEHFIRRATWFCVPQGAKRIEGFPVPSELDSLLNGRYEETREWISSGRIPTTGADDTIVEKIVSLQAEEACLDPYFLVFRQSSHDYARLCMEKPFNSGNSKNDSGLSKSATASSSDEKMPSDSRSNSPHPTIATTNSASTPKLGSPKLILDSRDCESARLYRTYTSFYHAVAGSSAGKSMMKSAAKVASSSNGTSAASPAQQSVQTQRQTNSDPRSESTANAQPVNGNATAQRPIQKHSFKSHPLPSPELPITEPASQVVAKHVIFVVHGVGQRVWRKMGLSFNKDCDELRNVLEEAGLIRGLCPGAITVLPVSWRSELDLAGNFTFGDEDFEEEEEGEVDFEGSNSELLVDSHDILTVSSVFKGQFTEILERLALDSIPAVRSVLSDATMDILLYVSPKHFDRILGAVRREVLRLYRLFMRWNPNYTGEFSFVAHSLGSALVADLLSYTVAPDELISKCESGNEKESGNQKESCMDVFKRLDAHEALPFAVDKFFAMGSPLGVFHLLKHTKPVGCARSPHIDAALQLRMKKWRTARARARAQSASCGNVPLWTVYNCRLFYNLFHPHDPVAHRFESLTLPPGKSTTRARFSSLSLANYNSAAREDSSASSNTTGGDDKKNINYNSSSKASTLPPPLKIPYHKSGLTRFTMDLEAKIARAKDDWSRGLKQLSERLPVWLGGVNKERAKEEDAMSKETVDDVDTISVTSPEISISQSPSINHNNNLDPLAAFNHHFKRVDFALQDSFIENPYLSALSAHFGYWPDLDIASFIVSELIKNEEGK